MFGKRKKVESVTVVTTKEQLKAAVNRKDVCIEIKGELAGKMKWMAKLSKKESSNHYNMSYVISSSSRSGTRCRNPCGSQRSSTRCRRDWSN